ncbi:aminoacyl-tRNA hydrolase [Rubrivirga litoralis]|uniref:Peptidyl-tRNA hydrolase n=1 Tax=Rubrivirga litoralis TaxID=3075598 RepID=A0ABU3BM42_9BACT|nr:aminoacyl-tRNA hydrolase [Rubrivirga sp. F394]MDT0630364.1 aminoacyl-tRNA hydrolase [Rubrivirga sp. F394]
MSWLSRLLGSRPAPPDGGAPDAGGVDVRRLLVGLGNPGPDYVGTRHNAGFEAIERAADAAGIALDAEVGGRAGRSVVGEGLYRGHGLALAKPLTFMNRSGAAYAALLDRYGLDAADVLLVYDDLALPLGQVRLRGKGSAGGHNGVQSVIDALGTAEFPRLRIGLGDSFPPGGQVDYVLAPFDDGERAAADAALDLAAEAALAFAHDGLAAAMNQFNGR